MYLYKVPEAHLPVLRATDNVGVVVSETTVHLIVLISVALITVYAIHKHLHHTLHVILSLHIETRSR